MNNTKFPRGFGSRSAVQQCPWAFTEPARGLGWKGPESPPRSAPTLPAACTLLLGAAFLATPGSSGTAFVLGSEQHAGTGSG